MVQNYKIFSEINQVAKENNIDLIIMGSHGASGVSEIFVGSNTEKVVRSSDIPVLVIKEPSPLFNPKLVVFACNLNVENIKAYHDARTLFAKWDVKLHLVYVNLPNEEFMSTGEIKKKAEFFQENSIELKSDTVRITIIGVSVLFTVIALTLLWISWDVLSGINSLSLSLHDIVKSGEFKNVELERSDTHHLPLS